MARRPTGVHAEAADAPRRWAVQVNGAAVPRRPGMTDPVVRIERGGPPNAITPRQQASRIFGARDVAANRTPTTWTALVSRDDGVCDSVCTAALRREAPLLFIRRMRRGAPRSQRTLALSRFDDVAHCCRYPGIFLRRL